MRFILQNIASYLLIFTLIVSMSGLKVYSHFCTNSGLNESSIFQELIDYCHNSHKLQKNNNTCCYSEKSKENNYCVVDNCCKTTERTFKLSVEFNLKTPTKKTKSLYEFLFDKLINNAEKSYLSNYIDIQKPDHINPNWGKKLLIIINNLKTEPNLF